MERSAGYTFRFAAALAIVASTLVATSSVLLRTRQEENRLLDRRGHVLEAAGLVASGQRLRRAEVERRFAESVRPLVVDLRSGLAAEGVDPAVFDQREASRNPSTSRPAPDNRARVSRLPERALVYHVVSGDSVDALVLPFEGVGLWSTIYGFVALESDLSRVRGITFYEHAETAGLGARITEPEWRAAWVDRRVFDERDSVLLRVVKGRAGPPEEAPFEVDGISGATLTGDGVTAALQFWLGEDALGPYLDRYRAERGPR